MSTPDNYHLTFEERAEQIAATQKLEEAVADSHATLDNPRLILMRQQVKPVETKTEIAPNYEARYQSALSDAARARAIPKQFNQQ
jgi:hypothetical protein